MTSRPTGGRLLTGAEEVLVEMGESRTPRPEPSPETTTSVSDDLSSTARAAIGTLRPVQSRPLRALLRTT